MATDSGKAMEALNEDVKELREELKALAAALKDASRHGALRDRVEEAAKKGEERVSEAAESLKEQGRKAHAQVVAALEERPLLTVLAAVGVGAILGCYLRGGCRS